MKDDTTTSAFDTFRAALEETGLPGTSNHRFVQKLFSAVERCKYFKTESQEKARRLAMDTLKPDVKRCADLRKMVKRIQSDCEKLNSCCLQSGFRFFDQLSAIDGQFREILSLIALREGLDVAGMHPGFRKKTKPDFECELVTTAYEYPFPKLGAQDAERQLVQELDALIFQHVTNISPGKKLALIDKVFVAGLGQHRTLKAYEVRLDRHKSKKPVGARNKLSASPRNTNAV